MNKFTEQRGAASVLLIFLMLVMVTLGAFAISSANANYKLNRRALDWNILYYEMNARGEEMLARLDQALAQAEVSANICLTGQQPAPKSIAYALKDMDTLDAYNALYLYFSNELLIQLSFDYPDLTIYSIDDGVSITNLLAEIDITEERNGDERYILHIAAWVDSAPGLNEKANGRLRYRIEDWYQHQEALNDEPTLDVWDGILN